MDPCPWGVRKVVVTAGAIRGGRNGARGVLGFNFACGGRLHAKLNRRTERINRTVAANMSIWIVHSDIEDSPDRAQGPGAPHEVTLPCVVRPGHWPFRVLGA